MSATDRLCALLDEHGIEYVSINGCTNWTQPSGYTAVFDETMDESDTRLTVYAATPEQAIAATVERETCHTVLMDCFGNPPYNTSGLNGNDVVCGCSECGVPWSTMGIFRGNKLKHNFKACPLCGRKVVG